MTSAGNAITVDPTIIVSPAVNIDNDARFRLTGSMDFPSHDPYWTATAGFIVEHFGSGAMFIAPRELRQVLPRAFPYELVIGTEALSQKAGLALHKGLVEELPLSVLELVKTEWTCIYANEVFLVYAPGSALRPADAHHQTAFHERLKVLRRTRSHLLSKIEGSTALVVAASHDVAALDATLRDVALLHAPTLVVGVDDSEDRQRARRAVCGRYEARFEVAGQADTTVTALMTAIKHFLDEGGATWICSFDDTMQVRPDFLMVMERLRSRTQHAALGGLWSEADGVRAGFSRDGFACIVPLRENLRHRYAHADHWRLLLQRSRSIDIVRAARRRFRLRSQPSLIVPGLVTVRGVRNSGDTQVVSVNGER